jgi:hypothetical protein
MEMQREIESAVELGDLTVSKLRRAWFVSMWRARRNWQTWLGVALCGACGGLGGYLGFTLAKESPLAVQLLICAASGVAGGFALIQTWMRQTRKHLRAYLHELLAARHNPQGNC